MDIIPDAGAVRGIVIIAMNGNLRTDAKGGIENQRDQMRFRGTIFSRLALRVGAGSIEISQRYALQAVSSIEVSQHFFVDQLALSVRIYGGLNVILRFREQLRIAIG